MSDVTVQTYNDKEGVQNVALSGVVIASRQPNGFYTFDTLNVAVGNIDVPVSNLVQLSDKYFTVQDVIGSTPTKQYSVGFTGFGGYIRSDKPLVVQLNDLANDTFSLPAGPELKLTDMVITDIFLSSVQPNTSIEIFITGR